MIISAMPGGSGSAESRPHELITQEEYNRKLANGEINEETIYLIDDQESIDLSNKADLVDGKVPVAQLPDLEYTPKYNADTAYPANTYCVHKGALWVNTSGETVQGVEPGTDYNKWNVTYSNENLLDNPWFTVNQRGQSEYSGQGYTVDRWINLSGAKVEVVEDGIKITGSNQNTNFANVIVNDDAVAKMMHGHVVTISVQKADGTIRTATGTVVNQNIGVQLAAELDNFIFCVVVAPENNHFYSVFYARTEDTHTDTVRAVKLELGPFSTLANDTAPDYRTELAKCQRYFQRIITNPYQMIVLGTAIANSAYDVTFNLALSVPMRAAPILTYSGIYITRSSASNIIGYPSSFFVREPYYPNNTHLNLQLHSSGGQFTTGETYAIILYSASTSYLDLSADL